MISWSPGIQRQLETSGDSEIPSKRIGEMVMEGLQGLDSVAYIRFASVYKDFAEAKDFEGICRNGEGCGCRGWQALVTGDQPAIVLVKPQLGENIGKAARAMLNFGLTEMRIVDPRDGWPNPSAGPTAAGADIVLEKAQVFETTAEAVADCSHVYATTVRKRGMTKEVLTPVDASQDIASAYGKCAILFGPERSGLEVVDVELARKIITVPINPEFGSLNLAQAVILIAYELSKLDEKNVQPTLEKALPEPAPQVELDRLYEHLERALKKAGYFYPPDRAPATKITLRNMMTKPAWTNEEIQTLRGVLSSLENPYPREDS